jgi:anthranilate phosphoribosyltransferase
MPSPDDHDTSRTVGDAPPTEIDLKRLTADLRAGEAPTYATCRHLVDQVLAGSVDLAEFGRWLVALAELGEPAEAIAGVAAGIRGRMRPIPRHGLPADRLVADTCGTGGDGAGSFNISTAAAIVTAAAGQPVAKHGNRAVSSRTGSADVLEALGVRIDAPPAAVTRCLHELGLAFCLAPSFHPAMARVGALRRSLGRPTVFNLVGPLCNPAEADVQVIGVGRRALLEPLAAAARRLGLRRAIVVAGEAGCDAGGVLDEVSLVGATHLVDVTPATTVRGRWTPNDFGLGGYPATVMADLAAADPQASAAAIRGVLAGEPGPRRDVVVVNAAAVLWAAGRAVDLSGARALAERAIDTGSAARLLEDLRRLSHEPAPGAAS